MPDKRRTDRAKRLIAAPPEALYAAQLEPAALTVWLPPAGATMRVEAVDPRPGGAFRFPPTFASAPGKSSDNADVVTGRYVDLTPPALSSPMSISSPTIQPLPAPCE